MVVDKRFTKTSKEVEGYFQQNHSKLRQFRIGNLNGEITAPREDCRSDVRERL